jgi:hypothetical protein
MPSQKQQQGLIEKGALGWYITLTPYPKGAYRPTKKKGWSVHREQKRLKICAILSN